MYALPVGTRRKLPHPHPNPQVKRHIEDGTTVTPSRLFRRPTSGTLQLSPPRISHEVPWRSSQYWYPYVYVGKTIRSNWVCLNVHQAHHHYAVCLTTRPQPTLERVLQTVRSSAPSSNLQHYLASLTLWRRIFFFNFSTLCIQNVNNTGTKKGSIMKWTAFWRGKNGECAACFKYSVRIFVE